MLQPRVPIEWAEVEHSEPDRLGVDDKSIALDVRVRLANGEQIDVEMQTQRHAALRQRALYLRYALDTNDQPRLVAWARFLTATTDEELETLAMEDPVINQAKDALHRLSADPNSASAPNSARWR